MTPPNYTDKYFEKAKNCVDEDMTASYGVFLRHESICAVEPALDFLRKNAVPGLASIDRHYPEGALVPAELPLFSYTGKLKEIVELETMLLQQVGFSCISAYNAYNMAMVCPTVPFMDMAARHCAPGGMIEACAYGASVGSKTAQMHGAKGFIGSSLDSTASFYGAKAGLGTMPHVLIGAAGSTLKAVQLFIEKQPNDRMITALVDYYGREVTDSLEVADWWKTNQVDVTSMGASLPFIRTLGVRLDTHGGRFMQGLDYDVSVEVVGEWLHKRGKWAIVKAVMGDEAFDVADDAIRDGVAKILFGTGVSAAAIIHMRQCLNNAGHRNVQIVASSGFNLRKCRIMAKAHAPIDMIGTGSFLPETLSETYATCDAFAYNGEFSVKVGREAVFRGVYKK